jgi:hypothetical protein
MIITTARKPSSKTRTFCKHLGRFTGWEYVTRGKTSREALSGEPFLLSKVTGIKAGEVGERVIHINDRIEFIDNKVSYIVLKVISLRGEGIA